jgi:protein-S-isoprenylcysteine O-methyltransferase Ste14
LLAALGGAVLLATPRTGALGLALLALAAWARWRAEDRLLARAFGAEFEAYRRRVGPLFPRRG